MSSSTSSSDTRAYRWFAGGLLALVLLPSALLFARAIQLGPMDGDLTRLGSHAESDYGWNGAQLVHPKPLYASGAYDKPYDMVVLGDSFSIAMPQYQWQNALVEATGLTVLTRSIYNTPLDTLLESPTFRDHPPAFLVVEIVERQLPKLLAQQTACDPATATTGRAATGAWPQRQPPAPATRIPVTRVTEWSNWDYVKAEFAGKHLLYGALRRWANIDPSTGPVFALRRDDLFTHARSDSLLIYRTDIRKIGEWDAATTDGLACLARTLQSRVERNGHTRFVLMVAPDKLTTYAAYVQDEGLRRSSRLPALAQRLPDLVPRLDLALQQAAEAGVKDLYLPNNTHWGIAGHDTVAESMRQFLVAPPAAP